MLDIRFKENAVSVFIIPVMKTLDPVYLKNLASPSICVLEHSLDKYNNLILKIDPKGFINNSGQYVNPANHKKNLNATLSVIREKKYYVKDYSDLEYHYLVLMIPSKIDINAFHSKKWSSVYKGDIEMYRGSKAYDIIKKTERGFSIFKKQLHSLFGELTENTLEYVKKHEYYIG